MKPTSIVAIIVAAVIIVVGVVTCFFANSMAERDGTPLFAESRGDDFINTVDLTDSDIIKISLNFTDADVNIYGSSTTSYIEFVNFRETLYSLSVSATSVTFSELPDFSSILKFWDNGFSFKGMRHFFNPRTYDDSKMKAVNIYLASNCEVKQFDVTADRTTVSLENLSCPADYVFKADDLTVYSSSVTTNSTIKVSGKNGSSAAQKAKLEFKSSSYANVYVSADELDLSGMTNGVFTANVACNSGSIVWDLPHFALSAPMSAKYSFTTDGTLTLNDTAVKSPFEYDSTDETAEYSFEISGGKADVSLSSLSIDVESFVESEENAADANEETDQN